MSCCQSVCFCVETDALLIFSGFGDSMSCGGSETAGRLRAGEALGRRFFGAIARSVQSKRVRDAGALGDHEQCSEWATQANVLSYH